MAGLSFSLIILILIAVFSKTRAFRIPALLLSFVLAFRYMVWRGIYTLNTVDTIGFIITMVVFLAELYGFIQYLLFCCQTIKPARYFIPVPELSSGLGAYSCGRPKD